MNVHCFQHVAFEGLGCIKNWIDTNNHTLTTTKFYEAYVWPDIASIDFLIIMGGPMGIYDYSEYEWLSAEKEFIKKAIEADKIVLGVCLGAQLIADVLGAKVYPNQEKELGWFPVQFNSGFKKYAGVDINTSFNAFHWHGDTFSIPEGGILHSLSSGCANQLFSYHNKVMAIQFHLEVTKESIQLILKNCKNELEEQGMFIQSEKQILQTANYFEASNQLMCSILDSLSGK